MKTLLQIITLSPLISLAAAAGDGFIVTFTAADCGQAAGAGGILTGTETNLPQDTCLDISLFNSFLGGIKTACANGETPRVTAFTEQDCRGTPVDAGDLPSDGEAGACQEIVVTTGSSSVSVGGYSAKFTCG